MKLFLILVLFGIIHNSCSPPVLENQKKESKEEVKDDLELYMEYSRYLKEVVAALESDPEFREKLEKADEDDIKSGKIAEHLDFVNHNVRTQLDEIKRREVERLRHLATQLYEKNNEIDSSKDYPMIDHIDHENLQTFEIKDLKKLIIQTTSDLAAADQKRREEFKTYEMEKEFEQKEKLEHLTEQERIAAERKLEEEKTAHKKHKPIHHPGSKDQLEEVWEKQDHMDSKDFDPQVFFMMHDIDGNGFWDPQEVAALFVKELDKMYAQGVPGNDARERYEEMERMREHVFSEADLNKDGLIDYNEFLLQTKKTEYQKDEGWKTLDENEVYTKEEYKQFEEQRRREMKYLQEKGLVDQHGRPIQVAYDQHGQPIPVQGQQYQHQDPIQYQQPPALNQHGQPIPPQYQQMPQGQPQYQQVPQGQPQYQQVPQGQPQYQQVPQGQQQYQQVPQGQQQYQQVPQAQAPNNQNQQNAPVPAQPQQVPAQPQQVPAQPNQVPAQPNQVPAQPNQVPAQPQQVPASYQAGNHAQVPK